jgi:hypothetical protein
MYGPESAFHRIIGLLAGFTDVLSELEKRANTRTDGLTLTAVDWTHEK